MPPFSITQEIVNRLASITARVERYAVRMEQRDALRLRKANRIKTIHSSLAIEGNGLTEDDVRDILNGQPVIAPPRQIQEVRNAIQAYQLYPQLDAFSQKDFLRAHQVMMEGLLPDAGQLRRKGVGVFAEGRVIHMAPPADRVEGLIHDLFAWLKTAKDHLIIRSCVFHYELEFIHPFSDGNGRMGRLWQSLILGKYHAVFADLPVENTLCQNTDAYYNAIAAATEAGESTPFIEFMLATLDETLSQGVSHGCSPE